MKTKLRLLVLPSLIVIIIISRSSVVSGQRRLEQKLTELRQFIGTAEQLKKEDPRLSNFVGDVMPKLIGIDKEFYIEERLGPLEKIEDVMAFTYEVTAKRNHVEIGSWGKQMYEEIPLMLDLWCYFLDIIRWRKSENYQQTITTMRPILIDGAYHRLIITLSLRNPLLEIPADTLRKQPFSIDQFLNPKAPKMFQRMWEYTKVEKAQ